MNDFLADLTSAVDRGSMVLSTERRREFGPLTCEGCGRRHDGGPAHAAIVQEGDDIDARWLPWVFADGFSVSDETANGPIPICAGCQVVPVVRTLRFADDPVPLAHLEVPGKP
jgi:hypothetical protein